MPLEDLDHGDAHNGQRWRRTCQTGFDDTSRRTDRRAPIAATRLDDSSTFGLLVSHKFVAQTGPILEHGCFIVAKIGQL